ncbi:MAG: tripartite tricarboxylate transporter TctB family protein, partial [Pseudomonadota bacterium]
EITDAGDTELKVTDETVKRSRKKRFYQAWGIILVSTAIGFLGGFLFSTFSLFMGFALIFGKRTRRNRLKNLVTAAAMTALIYLIFEWMMGVPLLEGIFS